MKKKFPISPVLLVLLLALVSLAIYAITYFVPAQSNLSLIQAETALQTTQAQLYQQYLSDPTPLKNELTELQKELDRINAEEYINDSNVSLVISDAIQRFDVSLSSVTIDSVTTYKGFRALPINLVLNGVTESILQFIQHFEQSSDGAYVVRGINMEVNAYSTEAAIVIYLCTPSV